MASGKSLIVQPVASATVANVLTLANASTTSGAGTQITFQGYTTSAQTATISFNGTSMAMNKLTSNGFVKTNNGTGTLSIDTTTYLPANNPSYTGTLTTPLAINSVVQTDGSGNLIANNSISITRVPSLTTNGFVITTLGNGTLAVDSNTYLTTTNAYATFLTIGTAASTYQPISAMGSYVTSTTAAATYQTISGMSSYLTTASAATTYLALSGGTMTGAITVNSANAGPFISLTSTNTGATNNLISLTDNSNTAALTTGMLSLTNTTAFANTYINLVSGTAVASTTTIQMSCGNGTVSQTGTITLSGATPSFTFSRAVTITAAALSCTGVAANTGNITGTGAWTLTTGAFTSTAAGSAGALNTRVNLVNTTNSATAGTGVSMNWTCSNAAGTAQQTGIMSYTNAQTFVLAPPAAAVVNNVLTLSNTQATSGAGTQITFQGYTTSAQTAVIKYDGTNFYASTHWFPATDNTYNLGNGTYRWLSINASTVQTNTVNVQSGSTIQSNGTYQSGAQTTLSSNWFDSVNTRSFTLGWVGYSSGYAMQFTGSGFTPNAYLFAGPVSPSNDNSYTLGGSSNRWTTVYATTGSINTSDSREKNTITPVAEPMGLTFINALKPVSYKWNVRENQVNADGTITALPGVRTHYGMIAQDVMAVLSTAGISPTDFAGFVYNEETDKYGLRYEEFISPMIKALQQLSAQVNELRALLNK